MMSGQAGSGAPLARLARAFGLLAIAVYMAFMSGLRVQHTGSLPRGIYREVGGAPVRGSVGIWCLPGPMAAWAHERGYIPRGLGCPAELQPLAKVVLGVAGDTIESTESGLRWNGFPVLDTSPVLRDSRGRAVPHVPFGRYILRSGEVWLWSPSTSRSFDSRHFGPLEESYLVSRLAPIWTGTWFREPSLGANWNQLRPRL